MPARPGTVRGTMPKPARVKCLSRRRITSAISTRNSTETISALVSTAPWKVLNCDLAMPQFLRQRIGLKVQAKRNEDFLPATGAASRLARNSDLQTGPKLKRRCAFSPDRRPARPTIGFDFTRWQKGALDTATRTLLPLPA